MKDVLPIALQEYLSTLLPEKTALEQEMIEEAEKNHIPIVEDEIANFLALIVAIRQSHDILEIGTAIGRSALAMAEKLAPGGQILTVELDADRLKRADYYFQKSGLAEKITAVCADAREYLPILAENSTQKYDLIFLDAAKGQYLNFFPHLERLLAPHGLIIADNVLLNGWVVDLNYPNHRRKTFVYRMRDFLEQMKNNPHYDMSLIPLGDGILLLRKKD